MTKYFDVSPMPNQTIATGTSAMAGIGRHSDSSGLSIRLKKVTREVRRPATSPRTTPATNPTAARPSETWRSLNSTPPSSISSAAERTSGGAGKNTGLTISSAEMAHQMPMKAAKETAVAAIRRPSMELSMGRLLRGTALDGQLVAEPVRAVDQILEVERAAVGAEGQALDPEDWCCFIDAEKGCRLAGRRDGFDGELRTAEVDREVVLDDEEDVARGQVLGREAT